MNTVKIAVMKIFVTIFTLLIATHIQAQTNEVCKYFQVLAFIRTNVEFNNQIKEYINFTNRRNKTKFIEFNISPWIKFIEIRQFKDRINPDSIGLNKENVFDDRMYYKTYNFEPFKSIFLEKNTEKNESEFYLTFSKVIGNTLLVEILNFDNHPHIIRRFGSGVKILFIFDQLGLIKTTLFNKVLYN
jgi:hypothetical protein